MNHTEKIDYEKKAMELFLSGYNCSQAIVCAFADKTGLDDTLALKISSSFGGGMGRLREVCGAVSGMFMVLGILYGYDDLKDQSRKARHYDRIQELARRFEEENGSIICRELLGLTEKRSVPEPELRTASYYQNRPCPEKVGSAARILAEYLEELEKETEL